MQKPVNDIIEPTREESSFLEGHAGGIVNFAEISSLSRDLDSLNVLNDLGHNVVLDSEDILELGNNIVITGSSADLIQFEDEGWTKVALDELLPQGVVQQEGCDIYMHESGAIVQIESIIHTNFEDPGSL